ncbi:MAG TPA: complex I NDUFA9 subunit family protein [Caulobacteraceae bacterium]|jgi:NADH dehydrogenase
MKGLTTVFGGSGFVGAQVVRALAKRGYRVRVAARQPGRAYRLRMLGDVGQIDIVQANVRDDASVARALDGAETCVNLVAVLYETRRQTFEALHVEGAARIATTARVEGATRLIHISALGASADSSSAYARTKAAGESAVRDAFPGAVVLRPSVIFGPGDAFFNRFATMAASAPALPLIGGGQTRFQPVFVGDVAAAVAAALADPASAGQTYELGGPEIYSFEALMRLTLAVIERRRLLAPIGFGLASRLGKLGDLIARSGFIAPPLTSDQVELLRTDNVVSAGAIGLADLGVTPTPVEAVIPSYLYRFRKGGQYAEALQMAEPALR